MIEQENAKSELARYMYNYERWQNHSKSRDICIQQRKGIEEKVRALHEIKQYPMSELQFFEDCASRIIECRQVLKWTYVIDFYARHLPENDKQLFSFQQADLENACEKTHQLLESDLNIYLDPEETDRTPFFKFKSDVN